MVVLSFNSTVLKGEETHQSQLYLPFINDRLCQQPLRSPKNSRVVVLTSADDVMLEGGADSPSIGGDVRLNDGVRHGEGCG